MEKKEGSRGHHLAIAHDLTYTSAVDLSRYMLEVMKENGWEGVTVGKCLGESGARGMWYRDEEGNPVPVPGYDDLAEENNTQGEKQGSGGSNDPAERPEGEVDDVDGGDKLVLDGSPGQRESLEDRPEDDGTPPIRGQESQRSF